jgi:hypothetical protein
VVTLFHPSKRSNVHWNITILLSHNNIEHQQHIMLKSRGERKRRYLKKRKGKRRAISPTGKGFKPGNSLKCNFCTYCNPHLTNRIAKKKDVQDTLKRGINEFQKGG